jgi:hypothetical protein
MFCPGGVPAFSKKGWQISLEECGATLVNKATIQFTTDQHFRRKERYLKYFVEIILKIKILNLSNLFGPLQYVLFFFKRP